MQAAASDNQLQSQNQSIKSSSTPLVSKETGVDKQLPLATEEYMLSLSTSMNSKRNPSQTERKKPVVINHSVLVQPERAIPRRPARIGLTIAAIIIIVAALGGVALLTFHPAASVINVTPTVPPTLPGYSNYTQGQPTFAGFQPTQWANTTSCIFDKSHPSNYHATIQTTDEYTRCMAKILKFKNFAMQVTMSINGDAGGVIFRDNGRGTYYRLAFNQIAGTYAVYFCYSGECDISNSDVGIVNRGTPLVAADTVSLEANKPITFTIIVIGSSIDLYKDNTLLAVISAIPSDANSNTSILIHTATPTGTSIPSSGYIGVFAADLGIDTDVTFSSLKVWIIPDSATPSPAQ